MVWLQWPLLESGWQFHALLCIDVQRWLHLPAGQSLGGTFGSLNFKGGALIGGIMSEMSEMNVMVLVVRKAWL